MEAEEYDVIDKQTAFNELIRRQEDRMREREREIRSKSSEELKEIIGLH